MNSFKMKQNFGFTLIELLIVIAIIGILAVAFLPTILGGPQDARDAQRLADLQKIQKILLEGDLNGTAYPTGSGCIFDNATGTNVDFSGYEPSFGGAVPLDPLAGGTSATRTYGGTTTCANGAYYYQVDPNGATGIPSGTYSFALLAEVENLSEANTDCNTVRTTGAFGTATTADMCYAILVE